MRASKPPRHMHMHMYMYMYTHMYTHMYGVCTYRCMCVGTGRAWWAEETLKLTGRTRAGVPGCSRHPQQSHDGVDGRTGEHVLPFGAIWCPLVPFEPV